MHISTQCNISNTEAVRFYAQWADVVVLARELNLDQVRAIADAIDRENITGPRGEKVKIEMFCHGALCMAVSGKCYLSLHQMNSSAKPRRMHADLPARLRSDRTRDRRQSQRRQQIHHVAQGPQTIHFLDRMVDAGVRVFKIEGRAAAPSMWPPPCCYSEALEAILGTYGAEAVARWDEELAKFFNRGF